MSVYWLKNFCGFRQSDFEMLRVPHPYIEFGIHVTLRSVQVGALLGSVAAPLSALLLKDKNSAKNLRDTFLTGGIVGSTAGAVLGPMLTYFSLRNMNTIQLYDKCYRLRFDRSQLWQDRVCVISAALGYLSSGSLGFVVALDLTSAITYFLGKPS